MLQNIRSIYKNLDKLQIPVNILDSLPLAIYLTETWINEEYDTACLQIDGYKKIVTVSRSVKRNRGGVGIFLKNKKFEIVNKYTSNECQILALKFCYNNLKVFFNYNTRQTIPVQ